MGLSFDLLHVPAAVLDRRGRVILINRAAEASLGLTYDRARGRGFGELRRGEWTRSPLPGGRVLCLARPPAEDVASRERRRLGEALAEGLGPELAAMAAACARGARHPAMLDMGRRLDRVIARAREIAGGLDPAGLTAATLARRVREAARLAAGGAGVSCRVVWPREASPREDARARDLYAIVGEALTNALRHGEPRRIWVRALRSGATLRVSVRDDGRGFDPAEAPAGMGLRGMRARARALGGELRVERFPKGGTVVECVLPAGGGA